MRNVLRMFKKPDFSSQSIKERLEQQKVQTEHQISEFKEQDPFSDTERLVDNADIGAEAGEQEGHERAEALRRELELTLAKIKKSLSKIGVGKYGFCEKCGNQIDKARLEAYPLADLCFDCERRKKS